MCKVLQKFLVVLYISQKDNKNIRGSSKISGSPVFLKIRRTLQNYLWLLNLHWGSLKIYVFFKIIRIPLQFPGTLQTLTRFFEFLRDSSNFIRFLHGLQNSQSNWELFKAIRNSLKCLVFLKSLQEFTKFHGFIKLHQVYYKLVQERSMFVGISGIL